ncbi:30S ribosomal protein S8 [Gemmatimonadota bacterium]
MSMTDPIADMLTRIRNGARAGHRKVDIPASKVKAEIARILRDNYFIDGYQQLEDGRQGILRVYLRYTDDEQPVFREITRDSRPGLRRYVKADEIPRVRNGLGIAIISTSSGVMTDREARRRRVGGEVLCKVW